jgi:hypothetical protein
VRAERIVRNEYVLLQRAAGLGVKVFLQDVHRHSCTISSFFLRVPRLVKFRDPQKGHVSGCFAVRGTRAMRGIGDDILNCMRSPYHAAQVD